MQLNSRSLLEVTAASTEQRVLLSNLVRARQRRPKYEEGPASSMAEKSSKTSGLRLTQADLATLNPGSWRGDSIVNYKTRGIVQQEDRHPHLLGILCECLAWAPYSRIYSCLRERLCQQQDDTWPRLKEDTHPEGYVRANKCGCNRLEIAASPFPGDNGQTVILLGVVPVVVI